MSFADIYRGKRVLITGHTGFKGAWLAEWLLSLGAEVYGLALAPESQPSLFTELKLQDRLHHFLGDIRDAVIVRDRVMAVSPDFIFHLAAQALVRQSYSDPVETYAINVMGTVHVLEAVRLSGLPCTVIVVTTDKCYENREWVHGYREEDPMGGYDPYSSSKGAAEIVVAAYRRSFFSAASSPVRVASARAGNVIGGGDWAQDRIIPDCIRALQDGCSIPVRNKVSTRPWQHVLEPLSGYLVLGAAIHEATHEFDTNKLQTLCGGFNFGSSITSNRTVAELVQEVLKHWQGQWVDCSEPNAVHEAMLLHLSTDKAFHHLLWQPVWNFEQTVETTISWYRQVTENPSSALSLTGQQIKDYTATAAQAERPWALS